MSEAVSAPSSAASASTTAATATNPTSTAGGSASKEVTQGRVPNETKPASKESTPAEAEELEEIRLGSVSGKVPKALAQTIRQLQKGFTTSSQEAAAFRQIMGNATPQQIAQLAQNKEQFAEYVFKMTGLDADSYSQARLAKMLERQMMDPKAREAADKAEKERQELETLRREKTERDEREKMTAEQKMNTDLRSEIVTAWQESGLPPQAEFGQWIAAEMLRAEQQKKPLSAKDAAARIKSKFHGLIKTTSPSLSPEQLEELVGPDALSKWREYDVKRITSKAPQTGSSNASRPADPAASKQKGMLSEKEYREYWGKKARSA
jgi:hypothetical protein